MQIQTNRLHIRTLLNTDWQEIKNIFIDFNHSKYAVYDAPLPTEDQEVRELTQKFAQSSMFFSVYLKENDTMLGYICFHKDGDSYDLGYCFHSSNHSNGYAYESIKALIEYFISKHNATSFTAGTALDNIPSCNLLKKLGFSCESVETVSFHDDFQFQGGNFILKVK